MSTKALYFTLIAFTSTACVAEMGDPDDVELSETEQSVLAVASLDYEKGWGEEYLSPVPETQTTVVDGLVGWHEGDPVWLGFGWMRTPALRTSSGASNITRTGYTRMKFRGFIPANGTCTISGELQVDATTWVKGHTDFWSGGKEIGTASGDVSLRLLVGGVTKDSRNWNVVRDYTEATTRTKAFDGVINFGGGPTFVATKGTPVEVDITLKTQARQAGGGEAHVSFYMYGFYANFERDAVHIDCY
jgi:hypothetical protein